MTPSIARGVILDVVNQWIRQDEVNRVLLRSGLLELVDLLVDVWPERPTCRSETCTCSPYGMDRCEYRMLADSIIDNLPTRDGDEAEVALCIQVVERVGNALQLFRTPPGEV